METMISAFWLVDEEVGGLVTGSESNTVEWVEFEVAGVAM
jgi:hypothetical protein